VTAPEPVAGRLARLVEATGARRRPRWLSTVVGLGILAAVLALADLGATWRSLRDLPLGAAALGLGLLLLRDLVTDVERWRALLGGAGHRVPFGGLVGLTAETTAAKFVLPARGGDAVQVVLLKERFDVPLATGAMTRLACIGLLLGVMAGGAAALSLGGVGPALGLAGVAAAGLLTAMRRWGRSVGSAAALTVASAACDVGVYAVVLLSLGVESLSGDLLRLAMTATVVAALPLSARGVGAREAAVLALAAGAGLGAETALAAALVVSSLEIASVVGVAGWVAVRAATPTDAPAPLEGATSAPAGPHRVRFLIPLLLALLASRHALAGLGGASLEHYSELMEVLWRLRDGAAWSLERGDQVLYATGGGVLFPSLHRLLWSLGLPIGSLHVVHFALDVGALLTWLAFARGRLPDLVVAGAAFWLALYGVPKTILVENTTYLAFWSVPMFAAFLDAVARDSLRRLVLPAVLLGLCVHFSLTGLFVLPAMLAWLWLRPFGRRWAGAALLLGGAAIALLPFVGAFGAESEYRSSDLAFALDAEHVVAVAVGVAGRLASYLADPAVLLGAVGVVALRRRLGAWPGVALAGLWFGSVVVLSGLSAQYAHGYYLAVASPARAVLGGVGLWWLVDVAAERGIGRSKGLVAGLAALALLGSVASVAHRLASPPEVRWADDEESACALGYVVCDPWRMDRILADLAAAGVTPAPDQPVVFVGAYAVCLNGAWPWARGQALDGDPSRAGAAQDAPPLGVLLMKIPPGTDSARVPGAVQVGDLVAIAGVEPMDYRLEGRPEGAGHRFDATFDLEAPGALYVGVERNRPFDVGGVAAPDRSAMAASATCASDAEGSAIGFHDAWTITPEVAPGTYAFTLTDPTGYAGPPLELEVALLPTVARGTAP